jgi:hypothetical protein
MGAGEKGGNAMSGKHSRLIFGLIICCVVLSEYSVAKPSTVESLNAWSPGTPCEQLSAPFVLSEWNQDTGSGGFPPNFSDERLLIDEWEKSPDELPSGSWSPNVEYCVDWPPC